jgi:hypothetical protein
MSSSQRPRPLLQFCRQFLIRGLGAGRDQLSSPAVSSQGAGVIPRTKVQYQETPRMADQSLPKTPAGDPELEHREPAGEDDGDP